MSHIDLKKYMLVSAKNLKAEMKTFHKTGCSAKLRLYYGLCWHIIESVKDSDSYSYSYSYESEWLLKKYFMDWKHYSGNDRFPIMPKNKNNSEFDYYAKCNNKYEGRQYKMRIKLINHIIKCLKRDIEK